MRRITLGLIPLLCLSAAPQDPAKGYLDQREWFGQAVFRVRGSGSENVGGITRSYAVNRHIQIDFRIQADPAIHDSVKKILQGPAAGFLKPEDRKKLEAQLGKQIWGGDPKKKEQLRIISIGDSQYFSGRTSKDPKDGITVESRSRSGEATFSEVATALLIVDTTTGTFDLGISLGDSLDVVEVVVSRGKSPPPKNPQSIGNGVTQIQLKNQPLPGVGQRLWGSKDLTKDRDSFRPWRTFGGIEATLDWALSPKPFEPVDLVLDIPGYESWLPNAGPAEGDNGPNRLKVTATLQKKGGGAPQDQVEQMTFVLTDVSDEPGIACNWPVTPAAPGPVRDLTFSLVDNPTHVRLDPDGGLRIRAVKPGPTANAVIASRDWGAWGTLHAEARLESGRIIDAFLPALPKNPRIPIPKRTKDSKIADAWKKAPYDALPDDSDDDSVPPGKATMDGDGLSLYEEYRGFIHDGKHDRSDPVKKNLFIVNLNPHPKVKAGIALFESLSKMQVFSDLKPDELDGLKPGAPGTPPAGSRRINANSREFKVVEQHGVVIEDFDPKRKDTAEAYGPNPNDPRSAGTPKDYLGITVGPDIAQRVPKVLPRPGGDRVGADVFEVGIAHELLHTVAVPHHGQDREVVWEISKNPAGGWTMTEDGKPVTMILEDGRPFPFTKEMRPTAAKVGKPGGLSSGHENCVMRYFEPDAYVHPTKPDVRINVRGDDAPGKEICISKAGTGINGGGWVNGGRFKDATVGNCYSLICVNDRYVYTHQ